MTYKAWKMDRAAELGISVGALEMRISRGKIKRPRLERRNNRVMDVMETQPQPPRHVKRELLVEELKEVNSTLNNMADSCQDFSTEDQVKWTSLKNRQLKLRKQLDQFYQAL